MSSSEARLSAASAFILQSPPGEVNDCFNDVRSILSDDVSLESGILPALERYNTEQYIVTALEGKNVIITEAGRWEHGGETRYVEPRTSQSFAFDHMRVIASDPQPIPTDPETETLRAELDKWFQPYVANHYSDGVSAVYALPDPKFPTPPPVLVEEKVEEEPVVEEEEPVKEDEVEESEDVVVEQVMGDGKVHEGEEEVVAATTEGDKDVPMDDTPTVAEVPAEEEAVTVEAVKEEVAPVVPSPSPIQSRIFGLYLVGNKYNPTNFWTGRWRSVYTVDYEQGTIVGNIAIAVHYYEAGNVQLSTTVTTTSPLPPSPSATAILALLKTSEQSAQTKLAEAYNGLAEDTFKGLKRALPKTRSKVDWEKLNAYRLRKDLGGAVGTEV